MQTQKLIKETASVLEMIDNLNSNTTTSNANHGPILKNKSIPQKSQLVNNFIDNGSSTNETTANTPQKMAFMKQSNQSEDRVKLDGSISNITEYEIDVALKEGQASSKLVNK